MFQLLLFRKDWSDLCPRGFCSSCWLFWCRVQNVVGWKRSTYSDCNTKVCEEGPIHLPLVCWFTGRSPLNQVFCSITLVVSLSLSKASVHLEVITHSAAPLKCAVAACFSFVPLHSSLLWEQLHVYKHPFDLRYFIITEWVQVKQANNKKVIKQNGTKTTNQTKPNKWQWCLVPNSLSPLLWPQMKAIWRLTLTKVGALIMRAGWPHNYNPDLSWDSVLWEMCSHETERTSGLHLWRLHSTCARGTVNAEGPSGPRLPTCWDKHLLLA